MRPILTLRHYNRTWLGHSHAHAQLVCGLRGHLGLELGGRTHRVRPQDVAVIPGDCYHVCASDDNAQCLVVDLPAARWMDIHLHERHASVALWLRAPRVEPMPAAARHLVRWLATAALDDPVIGQQGAALLLAALAASREPADAPARLPLDQIDALIDARMRHPLQVADLAAVAALSPTHFHARFQAELGQTPMDYVRERRLARGRQMLSHGDLPIAEVARQTGYASPSAFTAALVREDGVTPTMLRRQRAIRPQAPESADSPAE